MSDIISAVGQAVNSWRQAVDTIHAQQAPLPPLPEKVEPRPATHSGPAPLTLDQLQAIMPNAPGSRLQADLPYLNQAMDQYGINTPRRRAAFLAQIGEESSDLKYMHEIASGKEYNGRRDLGNTRPGDGPRYKGRGPIQLTGRANYQRAGDALGVDLVDDPDQAADPSVAFRTAGWFWATHNLNASADAGNFHHITQVINGGQHGAADRQSRYTNAMRVLDGGPARSQ